MFDKKEKIDEIISFVTDYPDSIASRAILRRHYINRNEYESGQEMGIQLKDVLNKVETEEVNFCFYLVK